MSTTQLTQTHTTTVMIGNGAMFHTAHYVNGNLTGSLCNRFAWETKKLRVVGFAVTCPKCLKIQGG